MTLKVNRGLPTRLVDGTIDTESPRGSGYGEPYVIPFGRKVASDEGLYFVARNATPGTGVAGHAAPTSHDTEKAFILLKNGAASGGRLVYLDYLKLYVTAAGTAGSLNYATHTIDRDRTFSSGGGDLTIVNVNLQSTINSVLSIAKIGAVVPAQANSAAARIVAHQVVRQVIPVIGDVILFNFGGEPVTTGMITAGTAELERVIHCPPLIFGPGESYHLVLWRASQSAAASYECEIGYWER